MSLFSSCTYCHPPIKRNSAIGRIRLFIGNVRFCQRMIQTVRNPFESIVIVFFINEHEWVKFISKTEQEEQSFLNISPKIVLGKKFF